MRLVCRRHRDSHPQRRGFEDQPVRDISVRHTSRTATDNGQVPVRCQGSWNRWTNSATRWISPSNAQNPKLPPKPVFSKNEKGPPKIFWVYELLSELHPQMVRKTPRSMN